jgi:aspartyl/glutamyl-tRNA(Asn/Gln) amidotransferase C subunit
MVEKELQMLSVSLLQAAKLALSEDETGLDQPYLNHMVDLAAKLSSDNIASISDAKNLPSATHPFALAQRLRSDIITDRDNSYAAYQALAPHFSRGLYIVPAVIE